MHGVYTCVVAAMEYNGIKKYFRHNDQTVKNGSYLGNLLADQ